MVTSAILSAPARWARGGRIARHRALVVLGSFSLLVAGTARVADAKTSHPKEYRVDASRGSDSRSGSASAPWKSIERANRAAPGSIVHVAAGTYDDAPNAPGVTFI